MSDPSQPADRSPGNDIDPKLRRGVSRRSLIREELSKASMEAVKQLPSISPLLGFVMREGKPQRNKRLVTNLWQLMMGRGPKPEEIAASLELLQNARTADDQGDALVDILWALGQTAEFEELKRPDSALIRGVYLIALDRQPTEEERLAALTVMREAEDPASKAAALEGLFTGLLRSSDCILRKTPAGGGFGKRFLGR
jgi:hypothetical protein